MRKRSVATWGIVLVAAQLTLPACAGMSEGEKQTWGTIGGALVGAAAGAAIGGKNNRLGGALIGAAVGGVAGYLLSTQFGAKATPEQKARPEFKEAQAHFESGNQAREQGQPDVAIQQYQAATVKAPEQPEPHVNMGLAYLEKNDRANAEASFRKALALDPGNVEARGNLEKMGCAV